jgi:lysylphosphatidylglycerol synthetase-like protein (DUF2156 family)
MNTKVLEPTKNPLEREKKKTEFLDRETVVKLVRKWADVNTDGILDSNCQIYFHPDIEGLIGYRVESGNAVVFGDPVCAQIDKPALATAFQTYCAAENLGVVYTIVSEEFANWASQHLSSVLIEFGEKFVLNPLSNPMDHKGSKAGLVRKKVKHALQEGVVVQEYFGDDKTIEDGIEELATLWQKGRHGPQVYLAQVTLFKDRVGKRWFYATKEGKIVGILLLNEMQAHMGWLLNNVMLSKEAPNGLSELLVIATLQVLEKENCQFVMIGPVPGKELGKISGLSPFSTRAMRWFYQFAKKLFNLHGHEVFWEKFQPAVHSSYLLFPKKNLSFSSVKALLKALNAHL